MKSQIIEQLGEADILLPSLVADGLAANDRIKVRMSALQSAAHHANLDPVVGGEPFRDQRRQQNVGLSELFDDLGFHGGVRRKISLPPVCLACATLSLR